MGSEKDMEEVVDFELVVMDIGHHLHMIMVVDTVSEGVITGKRF